MGGTRPGAARIRRVAREKFGFEDLRPGQEEAIRAVVAGRDTLAVLPTGAGKSAIYQIAATLLDGPTIVVSPLIALQRDQVENIDELDVGEAAQVNSTLRPVEREEAFSELGEGSLEFLFLAPEQFANQETLDRLRAAQPSLFVVDEAHCISEWGHDFRPEYLRLGGVIEALGRPTTLALTATAAPPTREEIVERLRMREPMLVVQGFDRPNIWLGAETFEDEDDKREALVTRVAAADKPGIVYAATRNRAEDVATALDERGVRAVAYHAGMTARERERVQEAFMADEVEVIVATTAFGMGIDKPNVRFVFHLDISDSIDSYYQEIGRAGRDGDAATAVLFYRPEDLNLRRFFASGGQIDVDQTERVAAIVHAHGGPLGPEALGDAIKLSTTQVTTALSRLEEVGVVQMLPSGEVVPTEERPPSADDLREAANEAAKTQENLQRFARSRIEMMRGYAEAGGCRREYLLNYFGERYDPPCGACDVCDAGVPIAPDERDQPFSISSRVVHSAWGDGLVMRYEGDKVVVLFDTVGYRTLALDLVIEEQLLRRAS